MDLRAVLDPYLLDLTTIRYWILAGMVLGALFAAALGLLVWRRTKDIKEVLIAAGIGGVMAASLMSLVLGSMAAWIVTDRGVSHLQAVSEEVATEVHQTYGVEIPSEAVTAAWMVPGKPVAFETERDGEPLRVEITLDVEDRSISLQDESGRDLEIPE